MPDNFEDELRRSLTNRAADVTPDPALFARVQSRIRRGRAFRLALAGVTGALALGGAALAAPGLIDQRVEFEPAGPPAEAPSAQPTATTVASEPAAVPAESLVDATSVFTDGDRFYVQPPGELARQIAPDLECTGEFCGPGASAGALAVRPGSEVDAVTVAYVRRQTSDDATCHLLEWFSAGTAPGAGTRAGGVPPADPTCPRSPVFSPDGASLAWVGRSETDEEFMVHTLDWTDDGPGQSATSFGIPIADPTEVSIEDWTWTVETPTRAEGYLTMRARREGVVQMFRMPVQRQGDGAIAVDYEAGVVLASAGYAPLAFASPGGDVTYLMEAVLGPDGPTDGRIIRRVGAEADGELPLPPEMFDNTNPPFDEFDLWLSAAGDTVLYGNVGGQMAWAVDWSTRPERRPLTIDGDPNVVHADLIPTRIDEELAGTEPPRAQVQVDVFFGMTGAEACLADQPLQREVEGPGVARAALTELLEGPSSQESNLGLVSPFPGDMSAALNDITIVGGQARVDFVDFSAQVESDACTKSAILDALDKTLLQFATVKSTRYSFDGSTEAWESWLGSAEHPALPAHLETAERIRAAAATSDWDALRRLSKGTSCTLSDQPEPCVPVWKEQEANGQDPLGTLNELLEDAPGSTKSPAPAMWVWPAEFAEPGTDYSGPRVGIDANGRWRYYVQEGG